MIAQEKLKEILLYDQETGFFTYRVNYGKFKAGDRAGFLENRYEHIYLERKNYKSHRLAFLYMTGEFPQKGVDHIDTNCTNNAWLNLRPCTQRENNQNKRYAN